MQLSDWLRNTKRKQSELAAAVGVSRAHISLLVLGKCLPSLPLAWRIEDATLGAVTADDWKATYFDERDVPRGLAERHFAKARARLRVHSESGDDDRDEVIAAFKAWEGEE